MEQREYQKLGTDFLKSAGRAILADEPGLGKTNQALLAAVGKTLIVAPASFESIWSDEYTTWAGQIDPSVDLTFASYSKLCDRSSVSLKLEWLGLWDTIIFDEAHYLKNRKTKWVQAAYKLKYDRLFLLTGTPVPNWSHEIFMLLRFLYPKDERFASYWRWVGDWFNQWQPPWGGIQIKGLRSDVGGWERFALINGLSGRWLRRERDLVLPDLPVMTEQKIEIPMLPGQQRIYNKIRKDAYAVLDSGKELVIWGSGGVYTKLHQISTGLEIVDDNKSRSSSKLDFLSDFMQGRSNQYTLILCRFRASVAAVVNRLEKIGVSSLSITGEVKPGDRSSLVSIFQSGAVPVLVATIDTISEGFTLTRADCVVFLERHPRPSKNEQARRRIHRFGQTKPCFQVDLVVPDSVDSKLWDLLSVKTDEQMSALSAFDLI